MSESQEQNPLDLDQLPKVDEDKAKQQHRRKNKRYNVHWSARVLISGRGISVARVKDVSLGGVGFVFSDSLSQGQELSIEMSPWASGKNHTIRAKGVITYNMMKGGDAGFIHGMKFTYIPKEQFEVLAGILKDLESA